MSDDLALIVYRATASFPKSETYGLISQMRRAAVSVPANITEGSARNSRKDYLRFLSIAKASLEELGYYIHLGRRLQYLNAKQHEILENKYREAARTLHGLMLSVSTET